MLDHAVLFLARGSQRGKYDTVTTFSVEITLSSRVFLNLYLSIVYDSSPCLNSI